MIELPHRSVTRFFVPMIDVLLLLFCIYLVMPMATHEDGDTEAERAAREKLKREMDIERASRGKEGDLSAQMREELERLRKEKIDTLKQRLSVRVLEVDGKDGKLFYRDPDPVPLSGPDDARKLINRDREAIGPQRELFYLVLAPRDRASTYPTREQWERYQTWFTGVALGFDNPGSGPGRKP